MKSYQVIESGAPLKECELEIPVPKNDEILIKTIACGVCHTDVHIHEGFFDVGNGKKMQSRLTQPLTMGHEIFGEVVSIGEDVRGRTLSKFCTLSSWI